MQDFAYKLFSALNICRFSCSAPRKTAISEPETQCFNAVKPQKPVSKNIFQKFLIFFKKAIDI